MKNSPFVSIICLCYNQANYVVESLTSVLQQTYEQIEIIIVDDASTDDSTSVIEKFIARHPCIQFIHNETNIGNCASFNKALVHAKGEYIIDLAADDILLPDRVTQGVKSFKQHGGNYGINFTDAAYINKQGEYIRKHYLRDNSGRLTQKVPQGNVFKEILETYFICSPTTMIKKCVLEELGGYDETLTYEDFDLWVRASRSWKFCYTDMILVHKRVLPESHGQKQYKKGSTQMESTYQVCLKAYNLCESKGEFRALRKRIQYEFKHALWLVKLLLTMKYFALWIKSIR